MNERRIAEKIARDAGETMGDVQTEAWNEANSILGDLGPVKGDFASLRRLGRQLKSGWKSGRLLSAVDKAERKYEELIDALNDVMKATM